jgi:enoyl-CoA hydratase/carnithine racemase
MPTFETLSVSLDNHIATVRLNRPDKANAMNLAMWHDIRQAFDWVDATPEARVAVLQAEGKYFTAGIDLQMMMGLGQEIADDCEARMREKLRRLILDLQDTLTSLERCRKPVLAAIHGGCIGGGIDLITCADMRYCSSDAFFTIKEIDIGMVADVGTLQRLPKLVGQGITRELAYTGRSLTRPRPKTSAWSTACSTAARRCTQACTPWLPTLPAKSPLSIRGTKEMLNHARDHSVADSLNYIATWNAAMLQSEDLMEAMTANMEKRAAVFKD